MEIIVTFILAMAFSENHKQQELKLEQQADKIEQLQDTIVRMAVSHSSLSAREKVNDDLQRKQIEYLLKEANQAPVAE